MILYLFLRTGYQMFYSLSYSFENKYNRWIKIGSMVVIFVNAIFLSYALFNQKDEKQYELCYLTIFIICTLLLINILLTLNPIMKEDASDLDSRSCCSSQNIMMTVSVLFCLKVFELHNYIVATDSQKKIFYRPFHEILGLWIFGLWLNVQQFPERLFKHSPFVTKYFNSEVFKGVIISGTLIIMTMLLRDAIINAEGDMGRHL